MNQKTDPAGIPIYDSTSRNRALAVAGKPVHVGFDGGRLTSDGGILLLAAVEQRLERLAGKELGDFSVL
jgi:hypothetical protein